MAESVGEKIPFVEERNRQRDRRWDEKTEPYIRRVLARETDLCHSSEGVVFEELRAINLVHDRISELQLEGRWEEANLLNDQGGYYDELFFGVSRAMRKDVPDVGWDFTAKADEKVPSAIKMVERFGVEAEEEMMLLLHRRMVWQLSEALSGFGPEEEIMKRVNGWLEFRFYSKLRGVEFDREMSPYLASLYIQNDKLLDRNRGLKEVLDIEQTVEESGIWLRGYMLANGYVPTIRELRSLAKADKSKSGFYDQLLKDYLPKPVEKVFHDLMQIYEEINFKDYAINQELLNYEVNLIRERLGGERVVLDVASGTGRLLNELNALGINVVGFDFSGKNLKESQNQAKEMSLYDSAVFQASWFELPLDELSVANAYCLGRSFCHNQTVEDWFGFMDEMRRILKTGGKLLMDIPDVSRGKYATNVAEVQNRFKDLGLSDEDRAVIFDSPDGVCFDLRSSPTREQMVSLAKLFGFEVEEVIEKPFGDGGDVNLYFVLKKQPRVADFSRIEAVELLNALNYFSRSNDSQKRIRAWGGMSDGGLTPAQMVIYGNDVGGVPEVSMIRDPRLDSWDFVSRGTKRKAKKREW